MRRITPFLASLALLVPILAFAQDETAYAPAVEAHQPGRWSMQFEVDDNFQLHGFQGAGLAATRNSSSSAAWRLGLTFNAAFAGGDFTQSVSDPSGSNTVSQDTPDNQSYGVQVDLLRLHRYQPGRRIGLELGLGPRIGFDHQQTTGDVFVDSSGTLTRETRFSSQNYGLVGRFGVEAFVARSISLHAHYGAFIGYRHRNQSLELRRDNFDGSSLDDTARATVNEWNLSSLGVTLGVSAYL
jgi:hypothetical protein